jgi:hypothetical protein
MAGNQPTVPGAPRDHSQSDDSKFQVAETARLQAEAQQRINANQGVNQIGAQP